MIRRLLQAGAIVTAYDPAATENASAILPPGENLKYAADPYETARGADAVLILTVWKEFGAIDFARMKESMRFPIVIDGRNLYEPQQMERRGFSYVSMGRPDRHLAPEEQHAEIKYTGRRCRHRATAVNALRRSIYDESKSYAQTLITAYHRVHKLNTHLARIFDYLRPRGCIPSGSEFVSRPVPCSCAL
jgi:hypothetical protein